MRHRRSKAINYGNMKFCYWHVWTDGYQSSYSPKPDAYGRMYSIFPFIPIGIKYYHLHVFVLYFFDLEARILGYGFGNVITINFSTLAPVKNYPYYISLHCQTPPSNKLT